MAKGTVVIKAFWIWVATVMFRGIFPKADRADADTQCVRNETSRSGPLGSAAWLGRAGRQACSVATVTVLRLSGYGTQAQCVGN